MKKILLAAVLAILPAASAFAQSGTFYTYPTVGVPADTQCMAFGNNGVCTQYRPAGPTAVTGAETIPADTNLSGGTSPQTVRVPITSVGGGAITINSTTGAQTPAVANGVSTYIYTGAGAATFTTFTFPTAPTPNQQLCLVNASATGGAVITLSSLVTTPNSLVGVTPTSLPIMTAVGTAGTVTLGTNCWVYNKPTTTWYRVQ